MFEEASTNFYGYGRGNLTNVFYLRWLGHDYCLVAPAKETALDSDASLHTFRNYLSIEFIVRENSGAATPRRHSLDTSNILPYRGLRRLASVGRSAVRKERGEHSAEGYRSLWLLSRFTNLMKLLARKLRRHATSTCAGSTQLCGWGRTSRLKSPPPPFNRPPHYLMVVDHRDGITQKFRRAFAKSAARKQERQKR